MKLMFWAGLTCACLAVLMGLMGANVNASGQPQSLHPGGAIAVGVAAIAFFQAAALLRRPEGRTGGAPRT